MIKNFRNLLAILLGVIVIPGIWVLQGIGVLDLSGLEIMGATVVIETLIAQFYWRKAQKDEPTS